MRRSTACFIMAGLAFSTVLAQGQKKDTLFFFFDSDYTIDGDEHRHLNHSQFTENRLEEMEGTGTNGYTYFIKEKVLHDLRPKQVLSLKAYLERRKFYFDGTHNKIVDKWKLKEQLLDKYTVFLVKGDEFIRPRHIQYNSYYPIGKGDKAIDKRARDTLFFEFDDKYIKKGIVNTCQYHIEDSSGIGTFFFEKVKVSDNLNPKKIRNLKEYVRSSKFYFGSKYHRKIDDYGLSQYLRNYIIFLVKGEEFVKVYPNFEIE